MFNLLNLLVKVLITFTCLISICCFLVSSQNIPSQDISSQGISSRDILSQNGSSQNISSLQDISFIYEEPIEGLKLYNTYSFSLEGSLWIWMIFDDEDPACILPYFHLRLIDRTGKIKYMDFNYTLPSEAVCPLNMDFLPLTDNHVMIVYVKSNNGVKGKYGLIISHSNESVNEIYLGNANGYVERSMSYKGFISIEKPDEEGIATWRWFNNPDITTGEVVEHRSDKFYAPILSSYTLIDSLNFHLIDGGFGFMYIFKYDEIKGSSLIKDPNFHFWRVYVSFLREGTDLATVPSLIFQTTEKLSNIKIKCTLTYYAEGYICIMTLNNTITNKINNQSQTEVNYYQVRFLSTGVLVRLDIISNPINSNTEIDLNILYYGGFIAEYIYANSTALDYYLLDDNGNYLQSWGSFGPEFVHYNKFWINNTIFGVKKQTNNKLEFLLKSLPRLNDRSTKYISPVIESTEPAINEIIDPSIKEITITFAISVKLSTANVSIFQLVNSDPYKPDLLRQTFSGDSKLCKVGSDNYTVHIPIFESTFNQPNTSYYVLVENNFVISKEKDEPIMGIRKEIWTFSTKPVKMAQHSDSITGLLRLNEEGSLKFLQATNHSEFFKNMIQKFSKIIPVNEQRLSTNGKWQNDPTSPKKILLSFNINEAKDDTIEPNSQTIFDNLSTLIKNKGFTELSNNEYTSLIDESAPFTMTRDYFEEFYPLIIIFIVGLAVLTLLYLLARRKNPKGKNSAIFETGFIIQDFAVDLAFTLLKVKNTPYLISLNMLFFISPIAINCLLVLIIFNNEITTNPSFLTWLSEFPALSSMFTLLSAIDILALNTLTSDLFGLKIFKAPLTQRSRKIILWGSIINIFIEDVPQFIIQVFYYNSVITYDLIPSLTLASGGLVIGNKLILRSYLALVRWHHRRIKIREFNKHSHLSVGSLRSIRSNVENLNIERENYNNNLAEEEQDLADISIESIGRNHRTATD